MYGWKPYVPVARRRLNAVREMEKLRKKGHPVAPVEVKGRVIAQTFWGKAWCENLERYSDFANRLPRGRTYVRNGSVVDLQIAAGQVKALVSGSEIYRVTVDVKRLASRRWVSVCDDCASSINSVVDLLRGRLAQGVMERICRANTGLFPEHSEIEFKCSCPDFAYMCKHVAAVLYGIGARLDHQPELLFKLRDVDQQELVAGAGKGLFLSENSPGASKVLDMGNLSELFGLEMAARSSARQPLRKAAESTGGPATNLRRRVKKRTRLVFQTSRKGAVSRVSTRRAKGK